MLYANIKFVVDSESLGSFPDILRYYYRLEISWRGKYGSTDDTRKERVNYHIKMKRSPDDSSHKNLIYFGNHRCLSRSEESKYVYCLLIEKQSVIAEIYQVFVCLCELSPGGLFILR